MLNRVVLAGRLTKDPDLRYTPNGVAVANFTIAVNRPFSNNQGDRDADFINCVVWRRAAENLANFMSKGSLVGVDGRLQSRSFDNQEGKRVFVTEVVADSVQFLESKGGSSQGGGNRGGSGYQPNQNQPSGNNFGSNNNNQRNDDPFADNGEPIDISDDDLPF
ncbi:single-stranded DNA-binding protein [Halobacillus kuroshimensis]|uniref:Single-stranded DNA-binding protein n=2 Tax=Halobacillus TaxID=45667 RepID=A0A845DTE0_9BACI|nr:MULTISPECIES: single-stranded DNA-binding protein [Halobacillus]MBN8236471.1 single-stranded DNA-binding protein [Halobacillus kuroshimensis]MYL29767.1 single-stranded DNA-binding protein [Halobacillus halophilus]MCA1020508.1 single-stranded DNA-binding protein [Halobacillus litoralis]MYL20676.1 single-stranded DNA-binding protein [Halobacillus litoralis]MYL39266.1 single-stranded DNA-binding protein [Halobacillus litoralis]